MKHFDSFSDAVRELFDGCTPAVCPVSGGDINRAYRLTAAGKRVFMKANRKENAPFFNAEVSGLEAIRSTDAIRVPEVLGLGTDERYGAFLLLEWVEGRPGKAFYRRIAYLLDHLDKYLVEPKSPSLLHGDLWSGNYLAGNDGEAWLIDPAVSVGHFEAELAMTELFGGFSQSFYGAYHEVNPIDVGYRERLDLYNLYHMLNHLNLFGGSYLGTVRRILRQYA